MAKRERAQREQLKAVHMRVTVGLLKRLLSQHVRRAWTIWSEMVRAPAVAVDATQHSLTVLQVLEMDAERDNMLRLLGVIHRGLMRRASKELARALGKWRINAERMAAREMDMARGVQKLVLLALEGGRKGVRVTFATWRVRAQKQAQMEEKRERAAKKVTAPESGGRVRK